MIRITQLKLPVTHTKPDLYKKAAKTLRIADDQLLSLKVVRQSLDARKKQELFYSYSLDVSVAGKEAAILKKAKNINLSISREQPYRFPKAGTMPLSHRPVIAGFGPAGMFCALMLARAGYRPLVLERGSRVEERTRQVKAFWEGGPLSVESNVQFGEGGAGTFSDGKLNTLVKDPSGRNQKVLEILAEAGADVSITYKSKPHVGTDVLSLVVKNIREEILRLGGEIRFDTRLEDFETEQGRLSAVFVSCAEPEIKGEKPRARKRERIPAQALVLAIGHSARDTFEMLDKKPLLMQPKAFAVGLRIQHPQAQINLAQYGMQDPGTLGAASYKLTHQTGMGRGVYSFCMCPGGFVVNASSEPEKLAVNGMSNQDRAGVNANSALIVTVTPQDFPDATALGGVAFQRELERNAYQAGKGRIPVQLYEDFKRNRTSVQFGEVEPAFMGEISFGNLREVLPECLSGALIEGIEQFGERIPGFNRADAVLAGVESRTSSPLRIPRNSELESEISGLYPCGEGAGYAGGITSAAMDGMRVAEMLVSKYHPVYE